MPLDTDPIDLMVDPSTGDLLVGDDLVFVVGKAAVAQLIAEAVGTFAADPSNPEEYPGEWFLDEDEGIPYHGEIIGQKFDKNRIRSTFRDAILAIDEVNSIHELEITFDGPTRAVTARWRVDSIFGDVDGTTGVTI